MTYSGGSHDPFGGDPFGGQPPQPGLAFGPPQPGHPVVFPPGPEDDVNTAATLSIIFAFVFAPVGAALGHVALSQIHRRHQRGRERAIFGLTISYIVIVLTVIALVVWLVTGNGSAPSPVPAAPAPSPYVPPRTTVITPPPAGRPTISVDQLRIGDCVEVQQNKPDPAEQNTDLVVIYPVACEARAGVLQVIQLLSTDSCKTETALENKSKTVFACIVDFKG